jgi:hypothetical protein
MVKKLVRVVETLAHLPLINTKEEVIKNTEDKANKLQ